MGGSAVRTPRRIVTHAGRCRDAGEGDLDYVTSLLVSFVELDPFWYSNVKMSKVLR